MLYGYDIFISYSRPNGGMAYAQALKRKLESGKKPLRCFLDVDNFHLSDELNVTTERTLRNSRFLILVGTPEAVCSKWVQQEINLFCKRGMEQRRRVAPLDIRDALRNLSTDHPLSAYVPYASEPGTGASYLHLTIPDDEFEKGPSDYTINRIVGLVGERRADAFRLRVFQVTTVVFLLLALMAGVLVYFRARALEESNHNLAQAYLSLAASFTQEKRRRRAAVAAAEAVSIVDTSEGRQLLVERPPATLLATAYEPGEEISALAISAHGAVVLGYENGVVRSWDLLRDVWSSPNGANQKSPVNHLAISASCEWVAVSQHDGAVRVISLLESKRSSVDILGASTNYLDGSESFISRYLAFLADGRIAVTSTENIQDELLIFDLEAETKLTINLEKDSGSGIHAIATHPRKPLVAIAYANGAIWIADVETGTDGIRVRRELPSGETLGGGRTITAIAFDPTPERALEPGDIRDRLAVGDSHATIWLMANNGDLINQLTFPRPADGSSFDLIERIAFSADGRQMAALRSNGALAVWQRKDEWSLERVVDGHDAFYGVEAACCGAGLLAVTAGPAPTGNGDVIKVWDLSSSTHHWKTAIGGFYAPPNATITALDFDDASRYLVVGTSDGQLIVLDMELRRVMALAVGSSAQGAITWAAFRPNANEVASLSYDNQLRLWTLSPCQESVLFDANARHDSIYTATWLPHGRMIAAAPQSSFEGSEIILIDPATAMSPTAPIPVGAYLIEKLEVFGDGLLAFVGPGQEKFLIRVDLAKSQPRVSHLATNEKVDTFTARQDGTLALIAYNAGIGVWNHALTRRGRQEKLSRNRSLACPSELKLPCSASHLILHPNGRWFAAVSGKTVYLKNIRDAAFLAALRGHTGQIDAVTISPNGRYVASGGLDGTLIVWNISYLSQEANALRTEIQNLTGMHMGAEGIVETPVNKGHNIRPQAELILDGHHSLPEDAIRFSHEAFASDYRQPPVCAAH